MYHLCVMKNGKSTNPLCMLFLWPSDNISLTFGVSYIFWMLSCSLGIDPLLKTLAPSTHGNVPCNSEVLRKKVVVVSRQEPWIPNEKVLLLFRNIVSLFICIFWSTMIGIRETGSGVRKYAIKKGKIFWKNIYNIHIFCI
jgi:hypothetical protein